MSIIAVHGFQPKVNLKEVIKTLAKDVNGPFEALNFQIPRAQKSKIKLKTCYLRLSEKLDPVRVVEKINDVQMNKYKAYIPESIPDLPLAGKPKRLPLKLRKALHLPEEEPIDKILCFTTEDIMIELQSKYPGLYALSKKTGHKLLRDIAKKIFIRLKVISVNSEETGESCFKLSRAYRRAHPHFGDFQLVLGAAGQDLDEAELATVPVVATPLEMPIDKVKGLCTKYSDKIINRMAEHISSLPSEISPTDTEDEIARKQVRVELKKLSPYLSIIVRQVVDKHLLQSDGPNYRIRIYGEPSLPSRETMSPFVSRYRPLQVSRSTRMYNLLRCTVRLAHYHSLVAMHGTVLNGSKLIIRSADVPLYKVSPSAMNDEMDDDEVSDQDEDEDQDMEL